ncbi:heavy metal translocating P-type ATPase [uncultured Eubacterium sp.]|uniref:heavy metal translocating P-type ATPase n=1 Tax=uncultured Eubacterium sp. TaxID=165185 RepID=UPI0025941273|nr:heavy metal translocating P-type ATPase [uncultured Eubacterium sp.]
MHKLEDEHKLEHQHEEESCTCECCVHDHEHEAHDEHYEHHHNHDDDCCEHEEEQEHHHHDHCDCGCCDDDHDDCYDDDDCDCGCHDHKHHHHEHEDECGCGHEHHHHEHEHHVERVHSGNSKVYILQNLGCAHCAAKMEDKINDLPGVTAATITYTTKQLRLSAADPDKYLPEVQKICASIESEVKVVPRDMVEREKKQKLTEGHSHEEESNDKKDLTCIISGAILFVIGVILNHTIDNALASFIIFAVAYIILGGEILVKAVKNISHGQIFDENFLMGVATLAAFAIRDFPEAVGVMLFYRIGEFFEDKAVERSRGQIMDAVDMRPEVVNLVSDQNITVIPAEDANVDDILLIRPGDRVPLDGVIIEGESRLDTSPITGEPVPVSVSVGDSITSGCVNTSGQLKMRVEKPLSESMVSRILESMENAAASKPKIDRFITRFAKIYTPCVVIAAVIIAILPSVVSGNWNYWIYTAISFLVMSCPCALVLSVPLAFFSGIGAGSKKGILFKGGLSMESLSKLGAVVMDKTGTITEGNFKLQKTVSSGFLSENELLALCAGCEQHSTHPIAVSIVAAAKEKGLHLTEPEKLSEIAGHGIVAETSYGTVLCGNHKLMDKYHIIMPELTTDSYGSEVFLAVNGMFAGYMVISDTIKSDAVSAIRKLKALGLHSVMLTGDSQSGADAVAAATSIDEVHAKLLPEGKLNELGKIRNKYGAVMFVGDGINDAPVLAGADVGAAMGTGADAAIEAADVVFMTSSTEAIPQSINISKATNRIAIQNVVFALVIKIAVMILGLTGHANMWMAVFADTGVAMICVLNSIRALYIK